MHRRYELDSNNSRVWQNLSRVRPQAKTFRRLYARRAEMRSASPWGSALSESQPMKAVKDGSSVVRRFPVDARYLAGGAGGRDSVSLVHCLIHLGYRNLGVCHLNYQLRGRAGAADADFVRRLVERYKQRQGLRDRKSTR